MDEEIEKLWGVFAFGTGSTLSDSPPGTIHDTGSTMAIYICTSMSAVSWMASPGSFKLWSPHSRWSLRNRRHGKRS